MKIKPFGLITYQKNCLLKNEKQCLFFIFKNFKFLVL
jgi:hypothetical protein